MAEMEAEKDAALADVEDLRAQLMALQKENSRLNSENKKRSSVTQLSRSDKAALNDKIDELTSECATSNSQLKKLKDLNR